MALTFQREHLRNVKQEVLPLLERHWEEIALNKETVKLDPDWATYMALENMDMVVAVTARTDGGELVGYVNYLIITNLHYRTLKVAEGDIFWLAPEHRRGLTGVKMMRAAEGILKDLGVNKIVNKTKLHFDLGRLFEHMGYTAIERLYAKTIG